MTIRFRCPHCKKPLGVKDHLAGKKASCPVCKKALVIPAPAAPATTTAAAPAEAPAHAPPADVDAVAAAALSEQPDTNGQTEAPPATIDFICEFCETALQVPATEAGKRMQCPNSECRRIVKVPIPKEKPKDWRDLAKKGPTVAQMSQPDKIDEAAWGTQTDKTRAGSAALKEAGALPEIKREPVGLRGWIRRGLWTTGSAIGLVVAILVLSRVRSASGDRDFMRDANQSLEQIKEPLVRAEVYRAIAEYKIRHHHEYQALPFLQKALASVRQAGTARVDADLLLGELALTTTDLGGTEMDEIAKEKYDWQGRTIQSELLSTLEAIKAPEARVIALRTLTTRLLEKGQPGLATGLASQLSNPESGRRPPATSQLVVLLLLQDKGVENLVQPPSPAKGPPELLARVGFAEYHARKGTLSEAQDLAFAKGPPQDQVEACVGVAQVILQTKDAKPADALPFVDKALDLIREPRVKIAPWTLLQAIRVGARVKGSAAVAELPKLLPPEFRPRGYLEIVQADLDAAPATLPTTTLADLKSANLDAPALDFGWEALARHNARTGNARDLLDETDAPDNARFRPLVRIGIVLGGLDRGR